MTTKERIAEEALTLFSTQGYDGTSVKEIGAAAGIRDSSIYKHYRSKREIVDAIVEQMRARMAQMSAALGLPQGNDAEEAAAVYGTLSPEGLQSLSRQVFLFYQKAPFVSRVWRLARMEQYRNTEIYEIYRDLFLEQSVAYLGSLFSEMIRQGAFRPADPRAMALNFYAPIYFLLCKYSGRPEQEKEALEALDRQVAEFCRLYRPEAARGNDRRYPSEKETAL